MAQTHGTVSLGDGMDWVGYVDWNVRDFHGYSTDRGSSYNAYLIRDQQTALIDTVKAPHAEDLLGKVASLTDLGAVDYLVSNHAEPDHAGAVASVLAAMPKATLVCDKRCADTLSRYFGPRDWRMRIVADRETISLGRRTLQFIETPMVHWPESMFTYVPEERVLFSMDAFGQHWATSQRFDDQVSLCTALEEAKIYYANIVMPTGRQVGRILTKTAPLDISLIAPSHGIIWRGSVPKILEAYRNWSSCRPKPKVMVLYDTMWQSTAQMAEAIHEGASQAGIEAGLIHVRHSNLTRIATEVLDAAAVAFGSATLNRGMMPMMAAVLTYLRGLKPVGKMGFAFGSHGWGQGGPEGVHKALEAMDWEIVHEPLKARYRPTPDILAECRRMGTLLAERACEVAADRGEDKRLCVDP